MTYSAEVLADSPIAYYRLGDASGTTMTDSSGNGRNGTYVNTPTLGVAGLITDLDTAVSFASASSESAIVTDDNAYDGISAFTVEAWIKPSTVSSTPIIVNRDGGTNRAWQFRLNAGKVEFLKIAGGTVTAASATTLTTGVTRYVAAVYNGTDIRIYIDGVLDGTPASATGTLGTVTRDVEIAARTSGQFYNGVIDEVATYASALTSTRIAAHYAAGIAGASVAGEAFTSATTMLDGTALTAISVAGELFTSAAVALDGSALTAIELAGEAFASVVTMLDGTLSGDPIAGEAFTVAAIMLDGSIAGTELVIAGEVFTLDVAMLSGSVVAATDTSNAFDGLDFGFAATVTVTHPVATVPPSLVAATKVDKAVAYPVPTMVNGRPT